MNFFFNRFAICHFVLDKRKITLKVIKKKDLFQPQSANSACRPKSNSTTTTILTERQMILEALQAASKAIPGGTVRAKKLIRLKLIN